MFAWLSMLVDFFFLVNFCIPEHWEDPAPLNLFFLFSFVPPFWQVDAERSYHQHVLVILEKLYTEVSHHIAWMPDSFFQIGRIITSFWHDILTIFLGADQINNLYLKLDFLELDNWGQTTKRGYIIYTAKRWI